MIKYEKTGLFNVVFTSYCGMTSSKKELDKEEAKDYIKKRLKLAKKLKLPVAKLGKGEWEFQTPDDAVGVSDFEGILKVEPHYRKYRSILGRKIYL